MRDILIKNMKMPKSCCDCPLGFSINFGVICTATGTIVDDNHLLNDAGDEIRQSWCPLVEIKPHGRLIDADALLESIKEARKKDPEIEDVYIDDYFTVAEWVVSATTIIEKDGGT